MPGKKETVITAASLITALSGISEARGAAFAKRGIATVGDLCRFYPRTYENRGKLTTVAAAEHGQVISLLLTIGTQPKVTMIRRGMVLLKFRAFDATGSCEITFFNQSFLKETFWVGGAFRFYGRAERLGGRLQLNTPKWDAVGFSDPGDGSSLPAIYPIYNLSAGLTQKLVAGAVEKALAVVYPPQKEICDPMPDAVRRRYQLCGYRYAIENIHRPQDEAAMDAARHRLIFEELMLFALGLRLRRQIRLQACGPVMHMPDMQPFYDAQPYALTGAQKRSIGEFLCDMTQRGTPMNRLLAGDVGSGKTVCAAAALYIAVQNGYQAALMAPTEILARQHFDDLTLCFAKFGFSAALLVGSTRAKEKREIKAALAAGTLDLVIGTHALLEDNVVFARCGLVVTDEQHRFGVGQRASLAKKAEHVHTLIMSATPIPRTLALMMFGDLDMSVLDEMPPGRQKVSTFAVDESYRARLNGFIRRQVEEGHQVYIVCPAVDENEAEHAAISDDGGAQDMKAAVAFARELSASVFPDIPLGFLHGQMKSAEKDAVMQAFCDKQIMILVSTTVIEVGVNVPNATLMVVENAERFGLSQLHQLRGRVGRGKEKSWCILVSNAKSDTAQERLEILCKTSNGYEVAQKDLEMRGPGDFFRISAQQDAGGAGALSDCRQSGGLRFEIASFCDDIAMVQDAFAAADMILEHDADLSAPEHAPLAEALMRAFGDVIL